MNAWLLVEREKSKKMVFNSSFLGGEGGGSGKQDAIWSR